MEQEIDKQEMEWAMDSEDGVVMHQRNEVLGAWIPGQRAGLNQGGDGRIGVKASGGRIG